MGASAELFGVIALMWHDSDTWQSLQKIWSLPFGIIMGRCLMTVQIAGGIRDTAPADRALRFRHSRHCLFAFLACLHPGIIFAPTVYDQYGSFFEQFSLLCGALALFTATDANTTRSQSLGRLARRGIGVCAISFALTQIIYFRVMTDLVPRWIPPSRCFGHYSRPLHLHSRRLPFSSIVRQDSQYV